MKIFFKYVLRSMTEKKGRFVLLILAISISTALMVASTGMVDIILGSLVRPQLEALENKEININATKKSSLFFPTEDLNISGLKGDSILKELYMNGVLPDKVGTDDETMLNVTIRARDNQYINKDIITKGSIDNFKGESCIISERTAQNRNLKIGDTVDAVIAGNTKKLKIAAISGNEGVFYNDGEKSFSVIVPYEYLSNDMGVPGQYNAIMANSSESTIQAGVERFNQNNTEFKASVLYDEDSIKSQASSFTGILYMMLVIVVVMSALIIYSSFKLIITERLSTIGTFLSQGATVGKVKLILYLESLCYGIFGAIFGNILGVLVLYVVNRKLSPLASYGIYSKLVIEPHYIIFGILFSIILSVVSSIIPVRKISKLQVKDIILNDVRITKEIGWKKFVVGVILIIVPFTAFLLKGKDLGGYAALVLVVSIIGVILAYPKLIDLLTRPLFHILKGKSKNIVFAVNNLRTSKILMGNITLIIISLMSIIMIISLGSSMINVVTEAYTELNYDVSIDGISTIKADENNSTAEYLENKLIEMGIKKDQMNPQVNKWLQIVDESKGDTVQSEDIGSYASAIGIDIDQYMKYNKYLSLDKPEYADTVSRLRTEDNGVIITEAISKKLNKKAGDSIQLLYNDAKKTFLVSGVIDGRLFNNGRFLLVKDTSLQKQFGLYGADTITFTTDKPIDTVMHDLKPVLREVGASAQTKDEMLKQNLEANKILVKSMSVFAYIAIVIASLGMLNNILISFLQRKSEFAILSSVGMENSGRIKILLFESIVSVIWSMLITSVYCIFGLKLITIIAKTVGFDLSIALDYASLPIIFGVSLLIVLLATIPVLFKSRKLSVIEEIKYE